MRICAIVFILVLVLTGCFSGARSKSDILAQVGQYAITEHQAALRDKVIQLYYPNDKRHMGLTQLIESYTLAQILADHGRPVTDEELATEEKRIAKETLLPEKLAELQAIFEGDHEDYLKIYVLPTLVQRSVYFDYFLKDPSIHRDSLKRATEFVAEASSRPGEFAALVKKAGVADSRFVVSQEKGVQWLYEDPSIPTDLPAAPAASRSEATVRGKLKQDEDQAKSAEAQSWIRDVVSKLPVGGIFQKVVNTQDSWNVVRYLGSRKPREYLFEAAIFPKRDFGGWLKEEKTKIEIKKF